MGENSGSVNCGNCHPGGGAGAGPAITDATADEIFAVLSGAESHGFGPTIDDVTEQDAADLEAYLGSL
jgi:mono/diheme cytochrome c family protein